jgi:hypothetical protein
MSENNSTFVDMAFKASEKTGEFWGSIFASMVNFSAEHINNSYKCIKIGCDSFKKQAQPALEEAIEKYNNANIQHE